MEKLLIEYKHLRSMLTPNIGTEESMHEVNYNDSIIESMENLLKCVPPDIANMIRLNLL